MTGRASSLPRFIAAPSLPVAETSEALLSGRSWWRRLTAWRLGRRLERAAVGNGPGRLDLVIEPGPGWSRWGGVLGLEEAVPLLARCDGLEGLTLEVTTGSPHLVTELDRLARLDRDHVVSVRVILPAVAPTRAARLDPRAAGPEARLALTASLAGAGLQVTLLVSPSDPDLAIGSGGLATLMERARRAGAWDVQPLPERRGLIRRLAPGARRRAWRGRLDILRHLHGLPRTPVGRG